MKSLDKVFDIMEFVARENGKSITPGMAAEELNLNGATCVRFMKYLSQRGYLEQVSRKDGYVLGPSVLTFADRHSKYSQIITASEEPIKKLAHSLNNFINISTLYNSKRYVLYFYSSHTQKVSGSYRLDFEYKTATARLLLSACDKAGQEKIIKEAGLPGDDWDGITEKAELEKALKQVRSDVCISFPEPEFNRHIVGGLIIADGFPPSAIGFGVPNEDVDRALKLTAQTVKEIENNLAHREFLY